jgi:hypothetical protein
MTEPRPGCHSCGAPLNRAARFCTHCGIPSAAGPPGASVGAGAASPAQPQTGVGQTSPPGRRWPIVAAVIGAFVLVSGAIVTVILTTAAERGGAGVAPVPSLAALGRTAPVVAVPAGGESPSASSPALTSTPARPRVSTVLGMVSYRGARMSAEIPAGWRIEEDEVHKTGYIESRWTNPANSADYLLIDVSPQTHLTPEQDAAPVHRSLQEAAGYREISYSAGDLPGVNSWRWEFTISGDRRVDYFFEKCTNTFGVLGSTSTARFDQLSKTFQVVSRSVQSTCS